MVKRNISFYERKKDIITKTWTLHERKSSYYEFFGWRKLWYYGLLGVKRGYFSTQEVGRKIVPQYLRNVHDILRTETDDLSVLKKTIR